MNSSSKPLQIYTLLFWRFSSYEDILYFTTRCGLFREQIWVIIEFRSSQLRPSHPPWAVLPWAGSPKVATQIRGKRDLTGEKTYFGCLQNYFPEKSYSIQGTFLRWFCWDDFQVARAIHCNSCICHKWPCHERDLVTNGFWRTCKGGGF